MSRSGISALFSGALLATSAAFAAPPPELILDRAWSIEGPDRFDASGIAEREGIFYTISDRHQQTIFRLEFEGDIARAVPAVTFTGPLPPPEVGYNDLEGIAISPEGDFLLTPEWGFAVCQVPAKGGAATWITPNLHASGAAVGLFATKDAYVEGLAVLGDGWFLLATERQPRGVIEIMGGNPPLRVSAQEMDASNHPPPTGGRPLDFADLCTWGDRVFVLSRNQCLVVELLRDAEGAWREGDAWSFRETEMAPAYAFPDQKYGQAEGLAIDDNFIHVLIDNNAQARTGTTDDRRSWLFRFPNSIARR